MLIASLAPPFPRGVYAPDAKVEFKALIGKDGAIQEPSAISGDPLLPETAGASLSRIGCSVHSLGPNKVQNGTTAEAEQ